jgi:hypothetical protein
MRSAVFAAEETPKQIDVEGLTVEKAYWQRPGAPDLGLFSVISIKKVGSHKFGP